MKAAFRKWEGQQDPLSQGFSTNHFSTNSEISSVCSFLKVAMLGGRGDTGYRFPQNWTLSTVSARITFMKSVFS